MVFWGKNIDDIEEVDLEWLINRSSEDYDVDFKNHMYQEMVSGEEAGEQITGSSRAKEYKPMKERLLEDISAFANGEGGWIICGMKEDGGKAKELTGLGTIGDINAEAEINRMDHIVRARIDPVPRGIRFKEVELKKRNSLAIVIRIPPSHNRPHGILPEKGREGHNIAFRIRRSKNKGFMTMAELRSAFNQSQTLKNEISEFRLSRLAAVNLNKMEELPVLMEREDLPTLVIHSIPINRFFDTSPIDFGDLNRGSKWLHDTQFLRHAPSYGHFNFLGYVLPYARVHAPASKYIQFYWNGTVEWVERLPVVTPEPLDMEDMQDQALGYPPRPRPRDGSQNFVQTVILSEVEDAIIRGLNETTLAQEKLGVETPYMILVSLLRVGGYWLLGERPIHPAMVIDFKKEYPTNPYPNLLMPDIILDRIDQIELALKPIFNVLWNAGGHLKSARYND